MACLRYFAHVAPDEFVFWVSPRAGRHASRTLQQGLTGSGRGKRRAHANIASASRNGTLRQKVLPSAVGDALSSFTRVRLLMGVELASSWVGGRLARELPGSALAAPSAEIEMLRFQHLGACGAQPAAHPQYTSRALSRPVAAHAGTVCHRRGLQTPMLCGDYRSGLAMPKLERKVGGDRGPARVGRPV